MSSTHLEKTKDVFRDPKIFSSATINKITSISPTVKYLQVKVDSKEFTFKPGQWVDFIAPGLSTVGGFSMCSSPSLLRNENLLELAVKYSTHPPAHWVHTQCVPGSRVSLQVGGNLSYEMSRENIADNLLLIAAGVGLNPLLSIMRVTFHCHENNMDTSTLFGKTSLCYTATTHDELLFKDEISTIESSDKTFNIQYFVTRQSCYTNENIHPRRMNETDLSKTIKKMDVRPQDVISYLCAPPEMMKEMESVLRKIGLLKENICYESWW